MIIPEHAFRELVNDLRDIAVQWHGSQQLRERIANRLSRDIRNAGDIFPDGSLTLDKSEVEFIAARMRSLLAKFGENVPDKDDRFIVGVTGSLIGNLLTNIELREKAQSMKHSEIRDDAVGVFKP